MSRIKLVAIVVGVVLVALLLIGAVTPSSSGPTSSSYATASDGLAAYADLLARSAHPVTRLRALPSHAQLAPDQTLVLLDPRVLTRADVDAVREFVQRGGRLVAGGRDPGAWLSELLPDPPVWSSSGNSTVAPLVPVPETAGVGEVDTAGNGSWSAPRATLPVLGAPGSGLLTVTGLGAGRVALLADSSALQNSLLASADNAALGVALAGPPGRPVAFEEGVHGYGGGGGLAALPVRWKWVLIGLALAAAVVVAARIRRLGPAEPRPSVVLPPRRAHVEALALALARTDRPGIAAAPVRDRARALVMNRSGLAPDADGEAVMQAAARLGLDDSEAHALASTELGDDEVVSAGRALAKLWGPPA